MLDYDPRAVLAIHPAAPVELAVAAAHHLRASLFHSQAALVAQPAAAPALPLGQPGSVLQTLPALRAVEPHAGVPPTVVGRVLQVDELCLGNTAKRVHDGTPAVGAVSGPHAPLVGVQLLRLGVFDLQVIADFSKIGQLRPARLQAAAL